MRLTKEMVELISKKLVKSLLCEELIIFTENPSKLEEAIKAVITEDLMIEMKLNEEVKKIIEEHEDELNRENAQYGTLFQMVKRKLIRERDIVL